MHSTVESFSSAKMNETDILKKEYKEGKTNKSVHFTKCSERQELAEVSILWCFRERHNAFLEHRASCVGSASASWHPFSPWVPMHVFAT